MESSGYTCYYHEKNIIENTVKQWGWNKTSNFFKLGFFPCKAKQPLWGKKLQEKEVQTDESIQEICLERTFS